MICSRHSWAYVLIFMTLLQQASFSRIIQWHTIRMSMEYLTHYHCTVTCHVRRFVTNWTCLRSFGRQTPNFPELESRLQELVNEKTQDIMQNLYASMSSSRIASCFQAKGCPTWYSNRHSFVFFLITLLFFSFNFYQLPISTLY